ncbi:hypothetical protein NA56DRAFT_233600 [Hyaloscypha hepaticicola]|uniref:Uncharacterized protein n=1 Tax=Hyaloscypha hepaticicola TaxID=2082293 RepID=A0A2J6QM67_9HELO|nr:hypothetical protein NA56DRAFT_233600 [Hyaloscypha hepaticicola]
MQRKSSFPYWHSPTENRDRHHSSVSTCRSGSPLGIFSAAKRAASLKSAIPSNSSAGNPIRYEPLVFSPQNLKMPSRSSLPISTELPPGPR